MALLRASQIFLLLIFATIHFHLVFAISVPRASPRFGAQKSRLQKRNVKTFEGGHYPGQIQFYSNRIAGTLPENSISVEETLDDDTAIIILDQGFNLAVSVRPHI